MEGARQATVTYRLFIAAAHQNHLRVGPHGSGPQPKATCAWALLGKGGEVLATDELPLNAHVQGFPSKAYLPGLLAALRKAPPGSHVEVITDEKPKRDTINRGPEDRRASGYRNASKKPLADTSVWQDIDALLEEQPLTVTARLPEEGEEATWFDGLKASVSTFAWNIGNRPKEWNDR